MGSLPRAHNERKEMTIKIKKMLSMHTGDMKKRPASDKMRNVDWVWKGDERQPFLFQSDKFLIIEVDHRQGRSVLQGASLVLYALDRWNRPLHFICKTLMDTHKNITYQINVNNNIVYSKLVQQNTATNTTRTCESLHVGPGKNNFGKQLILQYYTCTTWQRRWFSKEYIVVQ